MKKPTYSLLLFFLIALTGTGNSLAENSSTNRTPLKLNAGLGAFYRSNPYRGADSDIIPFPLLTYEGRNFFLRGTKLGYHLFKKESLILSLLGSYRGDGYESGDSSFLQGMEDRDGTLEAGLQASVATPFGRLSASLLSDVLSEHSGHEVKISLSKRFSLQKLSVIPSASVIWQSSQLTNYYYGVRTIETSMNRPAYKVGSSSLVKLGVMMNYRLVDRWSVTGQFGVIRLADKITDSPIVEDDFVASGFVGCGYQF